MMGAVTILVDNKAAEGFVAEHGFALWIDVLAMENRVILFDTGNQEALLPNIRRLNLNISSLTDLVLSHGHYDHSGGVEAVLKLGGDMQVYLHQAAMQPRYVSSQEESKPVRMPLGSMQLLWQVPDDSIHWLTQPFKFSERIGLTGPIPRLTSYEDTGGAFFYDPWGKRPDPIDDDNALWLQTPDGLVIFVGCSHAGIVNTIKAIIEITGARKIHTIIGGLHLSHASAERLDKTAAALNELDLQRLVACHCSGDESFSFLQNHLECEVIQGYAGFSMTF